jgi:hypothetical protein
MSRQAAQRRAARPAAIGNGKSEAVAFLPDATAPTILAPLHTLAPGREVQWAPGYKYLGYQIRWDLSEQPMADRAKGAMIAAARRLFTAAPVVWGLPAAVQLQLVQSYVLGSASYIAGMLCLTKSEWEKLDTVLVRVLRGVLRLPAAGTPSVHLSLVAGAPPFRAHALAAGRRLAMAVEAMQLSHPDSPAVMVLRVVAAGASPTQSRARQSWLACLEALQQDLEGTSGPRTVVVESPFHIGMHARSLRRRTAHWDFLFQALVNPAGDPRRTTSATRPRAVPSLHAVQDVVLCGTPYVLAHTCHPHLSILGPGGPGSLWTMTSYSPRQLRVVSLWSLGRLAVYSPPYTPRHLLAPEWVGGGGVEDEGWVSEWSDRLVTATDRHRLARCDLPCDLCPRDATTHDDPWHMVNECGDERVAAAREVVRSSLPAMLRTLVERVVEAHSPDYIPGPRRAAPTEVVAAARRVYDALDRLPTAAFAEGEGAFITFRALGVLPWPAAAAAPGHNLVLALGELFDATMLPRHALGRLARHWTHWAIRAHGLLAEARRQAYAAHTAQRLATRSGPPPLELIILDDDLMPPSPYFN